MHFVAMTDTIVCFIQWNQSQTKYAIPQDHVPGDEHCELFIPIDIPKEQFRKNYEQ